MTQGAPADDVVGRELIAEQRVAERGQADEKPGERDPADKRENCALVGPRR